MHGYLNAKWFAGAHESLCSRRAQAFVFLYLIISALKKNCSLSMTIDADSFHEFHRFVSEACVPYVCVHAAIERETLPWLSEHGKHLRDKKWLKHPCFLLGLVLYAKHP